MKLSIIIDSRNVGMQVPHQAAKSLRVIADKLNTAEVALAFSREEECGGKILDHNGNSVGEWSLSK